MKLTVIDNMHVYKTKNNALCFALNNATFNAFD